MGQFSMKITRSPGSVLGGNQHHEVRLIPPAYVKPFVTRHKNDAVDAEATSDSPCCNQVEMSPGLQSRSVTLSAVGSKA